MPSHDFIDVRVIVDGTPLTEYPDPEAGEDEARTYIRFVEAKTDKHFSIRVRLQPGFDFQDAPYAVFKIELDHQGVVYPLTFARDNTSVTNGIVRKSLEKWKDSVKHHHEYTGEWRSHPLLFGSLDMSKSFGSFCSD
jgi:hypothetical protein